MRINFILSLSDAQGLRVADPNLKKNGIRNSGKPDPTSRKTGSAYNYSHSIQIFLFQLWPINNKKQIDDNILEESCNRILLFGPVPDPTKISGYGSIALEFILPWAARRRSCPSSTGSRCSPCPTGNRCPESTEQRIWGNPAPPAP